ncbi:hypothetical protein QMK17_16555 [Rhodococcus sp. G-MC3]|uniref:hypothetical protein n=1 Tax=Rhodococcus sp. G-MC3 TaxID=3046209 RepID=UPI0024BA615D|nr:hypothetical protein [Rhodococcus sp. G-MC3]MDJ0394938.1 hypothetical protein [Rhodococcus sp. G-MC3]
MTVVTLLLLALSAAVSTVPARGHIIRRTAAIASAAALGVAAITGVVADPAQGFALGVTYTVTVVVAVVGGSPIVTAVFDVARRDGSPHPDGPPGPLRGGLTIGILERTAVAASVMTGWPEGIAIVLAVKGLARYPELRNVDATASAGTGSPGTGSPETPAPSPAASASASEQFIIGTFTSVMWAVAVCGVGYLLTT